MSTDQNAGESDRNIPPPPMIIPHGELRPVIEPPLRDLAPFPGTDVVEEWKPFASGPGENKLPDDLVRKAQDVALADERVKRLLAQKRYIAIGASLLEKRDKPAATSLVFVFYNYTDDRAIEVSLDQAAQKISDVAELRYQPPPPRQEIDHAIALARKDSRLAERITDELEGNAILVSPADSDNPNYSHRQFEVRFGNPTERLAKYMALVDLSMETILKVARISAD